MCIATAAAAITGRYAVLAFPVVTTKPIAAEPIATLPTATLDTATLPTAIHSTSTLPLVASPINHADAIAISPTTAAVPIGLKACLLRRIASLLPLPVLLMLGARVHLHVRCVLPFRRWPNDMPEYASQMLLPDAVPGGLLASCGCCRALQRMKGICHLADGHVPPL